MSLHQINSQDEEGHLLLCPTYRNYLNVCQGTHLIFYLSEVVLIRGGGGEGHSSEKCKVGTS